MKNTKLNQLNSDEMYKQTNNLFQFISQVYDIKECEDEFFDYFIRYAKKYYPFMTFQDIEDAFEQNSVNRIDNYLQKIGSRPDNKVKSFNIPDLTKIINAFNNFKGFEKRDETSEIWNPIMKRSEPNVKTFSDSEKANINNAWCDRIAMIFEKYRDEFEETPISTPLFTARILAKHKALDLKDIDLTERTISVKFGKYETNNNEKLIYKTFDKIIQEQGHIEDYLKKQRRGLEQMPW